MRTDYALQNYVSWISGLRAIAVITAGAILVSSLCLSVKCFAEKPEYQPVDAKLFTPRDGLGNVIKKMQDGETVTVAYLGGSITAANGWRPMTSDWLAEHYFDTTITEIHASIGGTGSDLGVFRVGHDALAHNPDLLFIEFSVNDGGASPEQIWKGMEGIVRQTWKANPKTDICFVYTFRTGYENDLNTGKYPRAAGAMEMLAEHYGIPTINVALPIVEAEKAGKLIFKSDEATPEGIVRFSSDGVHPLSEGHQMYTDTIADAFKQMETDPQPVDHSSKLKTPFVEDNWEQAKMVPLNESMFSGDWRKLGDDESLQRSFGNRMGQLWEATEPGSKLTFKFRGTTAKLYDLLGPDCGQVYITVDGVKREKPVARFDSYCTYHRIASLMIAAGLDPNETHTVTVEIDSEQPDRTPVAFRLKNPDEELKQEKFQGTKVRAGQIMLIGDLVE